MADVYTEGYRIGFVNTGKDLSRKGTVEIRYVIGFERVVKAAIKNFKAMGLKPVFCRSGRKRADQAPAAEDRLLWRLFQQTV